MQVAQTSSRASNRTRFARGKGYATDTPSSKRNDEPS